MVRSPLLAGLLPPLTGAYFVALDVWGDDWAWIKEYKPTHQLIFSLLIGVGLLCLFFRALGDWLVKPNFSEGETYGAVLESLLVSITRIIGAKSERFKSKISGIKTNTNTFELITHPNDQIAVILREAKAFLKEVLELKDEQLGITVLRGESENGPWSYLACGNEHWQHTVPEELLEKRSTARPCRYPQICL